MTKDELSQLSDGNFSEVVGRQVLPNATDQEILAALLSEELIVRTHAALNALANRVAGHVKRINIAREEFRTKCMARGNQGRMEWHNTKFAFEQSKQGKVHYLKCVQGRLSQANRQLRDYNRARNHENIDHTRNTVRLLAIAIQRHQAAHVRTGGIAEQADYELWQLLDHLTLMFHEKETPLRRMVDMVWTEVFPVTDQQRATEAAREALRRRPAF